MAAKNKFKGRGRTAFFRQDRPREDVDLQDLMGLHFQACRRAEEVEEQIEELRAAGKHPEALVMRMQAEGIQQGLRAIEAEVRLAVRTPKQPPTARLLPVRSPGPDFETTMDTGISLEIPR
jgi:hypothetical protein